MDSRNGVWQCTRLVVRYCTHSVRARTQLRPSPVACAGVRACMRVRVRRVRVRRVLAANAGRLGSPQGRLFWLSLGRAEHSRGRRITADATAREHDPCRSRHDARTEKRMTRPGPAGMRSTG